MGAKSDVVVELKTLLKYCAVLEELPHSFDDTLIDNLISKVDIMDIQLMDFIRTSFSSENFETGASVGVCLLLRLYAKYCQSLSGIDKDVTEQLERTEVLLQQNRPAKVLSDLFSLYAACYHLKGKDGWKNVMQWSVSHLLDEGLSIFIRRQIGDFLCLSKYSDEVQLFLPTIVELFCFTDSTHVLNDSARVLIHFSNQLNSEQIRNIVNTVQCRDMVGDVVYELVVKVKPDMELMDDLFPTKWKSEMARCHTIVKFLQRSPKHHDKNGLLASVFVSSSMKLRAFVDVIELLDAEALCQYLPIVCRIIMDRRRAPLSDLQLLLSKLSTRLSLSEISKVLDVCFPRLLESPYLIEVVCTAYGSDCLNHSAMVNIRDRLAIEINKAMSHSDWGVRDTAVEIAVIVPFFRPMLGSLAQLIRLDSSPYVRAAALRCLVLDAQYHQHELPQLCESVVTTDPDAEPRLVAIRYLHGTLTSNIRHVFNILPKAIEDSDDEVRRLMVDMCSTLLAREEYAVQTAAELQEWKEDPEIGAAVRAVLGEPPVDQPDPIGHILADMINALHLHFNDTVDCY